MKAHEDKSHKIYNELLIRKKNRTLKQTIKVFLRSYHRVARTALDFRCECSKLDCQGTIKLTIPQYEKLHTRADRFIICLGHESPEIEKVVSRHHDYAVVEKFILPPN